MAFAKPNSKKSLCDRATSVSIRKTSSLLSKNSCIQIKISFLRELVSNAVDATRKLDMLIRKGEAERLDFNPQITIRLDKEAKTLTISDDGLGMDEEEVIKYLSDIAFSSAEEFAEKFKDLDDRAEIIGHFGLGFYSAFYGGRKSNRSEPLIQRRKCTTMGK